MRTRRITTDEYRQLRKRYDLQTRIITDIAWQTGLRISDILALTVGDCQSCRINVCEQKTKKHRIVHVTAAVRKSMLQYAAQHGRQATDPIFTVDRSTVYRHIKTAATTLGYQRVSAHSYRKAYAYSYNLRYGLIATQRELQHNDIATTCIYVFDIDAPPTAGGQK